jgi:DnaK suppressor protein
MSAAPSPLNASQRNALQAKLVARRLALRAEIETKLNTQDNPALLGMRNRMEETDDWAVADLESALDVAEVSRDAAELQEVEAALSRIKNNTYGICLECGKPIPIARLDISPMSARCVGCQELLETAMRRTGAGTL